MSSASDSIFTPSALAQSPRLDRPMPQGLLLTSMFLKTPATSGGKLLSIITRYRRRSTTLGTCSMNTGHCSMQDMQLVQDQSSSSVTALPMIGVSAGASFAVPFPSIMGRSFCRCAFRSWISFFGESGFSVKYAGQRSWHRPHRVQASRSKSCFQVNSGMVVTPYVSRVSKSVMGASTALGPVERRMVFRVALTT